MESKFKVGELVMATDEVADENGYRKYDVLGVITEVIKPKKNYARNNYDTGVKYTIDWNDGDNNTYPENLVEGYAERYIRIMNAT